MRTVRRGWKERWFTLPWRPWVATKEAYPADWIKAKITKDPTSDLCYPAFWARKELLNEEQIFEFLKEKKGPWKIYLNPMRDDGVFLAQDTPHRPYEGVWESDGSPMYPATPQRSYSYPNQLPLDMAQRLVTRLNALSPPEKCSS